MRGKLSGYLDVAKLFKVVLRVLFLTAASFFVYILIGGQEVFVSSERLQISLQSDKNGEGCYLFLPSFAGVSDVAVWLPEEGKAGRLIEREEGTADGSGEKGRQSYNGEAAECGASKGRVLIQSGEKVLEAEVLQSQNMPCLWVETEEPLEELEADKEKESGGKLTLYLPGGRKAFQGEIEAMHGHGNSTWYENKKSWQIKLSAKASLLGMDPAKKWLLISNIKDPSMMRNKLFLDMAKECGLPGALSCEWVDLYVNGEYQGLYLLSEKVDVASGRLEIGDLEAENKELNGDVESYQNYTLAGAEETLLQGWFLFENPKNIEGGYLLEMEYPVRYAAEPSKFLTRNGQYVVVKSPAYASVEEIQYIYAFVQDFESALFAKDGYLPEGEALDPGRTGISYTEMMDMDSFAGRYVLDEISKNIDANSSSVFFYKPRYADKLYAGPVWDYDLALGNSGGWGEADELHQPEGFYANLAGWNKTLYEKPEFYAAVEQNYQKNYGLWLEKFLEKGYDEYKEQIKVAAHMDNRYRGIDTWEEGSEEMREFLEKRKKWLDEQWGNGQ